MPTFRVERYELCSTKVDVEADSPEEAVLKVFQGEGDPVGDSVCEYIESADDYGISADDNPEIADLLRANGYGIDDIIPSIREVEEVEPGEEDDDDGDDDFED